MCMHVCKHVHVWGGGQMYTILRDASNVLGRTVPQWPEAHQILDCCQEVLLALPPQGWFLVNGAMSSFMWVLGMTPRPLCL